MVDYGDIGISMSTTPTSPASQTPGGVSLPPLTRVGRFQVEAHLGTGGMGDVYRAWDPVLERSVALKLLRPGDREAGATERFRREALALALVSHPHVCQVYDLVEDPRGTFIAMELVDGLTLDQAALHMGTREKLQVVLGVAQALEAAHAKGIVHRDLKPHNVMVHPGQHGAPPLVKVLDFGLVRLVDARPAGQAAAPEGATPAYPTSHEDTAPQPAEPPSSGSVAALHGSGPHSWDGLTQAGMFMGSPGYASPEQIQGQSVGPGSDIFSLGILAWELLTGEHPFPGEGRARMKAIAHGERRDLKTKGLPAGTAELLKAMLEPHPFKRPSAARVSATLARLVRPRRVLPWVILSAAAAVALTAGALWQFGRGVLSDLPRQHAVRLAILPFDNATGDSRLDSIAGVILPEMLEMGLALPTRLAPIDALTLARARAGLKLAPKGPLAPGDQARLATALGAQVLLRGQLSRSPDGSLVFRYELADARGKVRHGGTAQQAGERTVVAMPLARLATQDLLRAVAPFAPSTRALPEVPAQVLEVYARAADLMEKGNFKDAAPAFQAATRAAPDYAPAVLGYARCLMHQADADPEPIFHWARWAARAQGNRILEMRALISLAVRQGERGQWEAADHTCREALALAGVLGEATSEAEVRALMGVNLQRRHLSGEALAELERALALYQNLGIPQAATHALNSLAVLERERGHLKEAEAHYQNALRTAQSYGDRWSEAFLNNNLGDLALALEGSFDHAEEHFRKAQELRAAIGDDRGMTYTLMGLGSVRQARGDYGGAEAMDQQFLAQARSTGLRPMEALALYNLGEVTRAAGRLEQARAWYRQSLALHQELKDTTMEVHCLAGEAECLARDGRAGMARTLLERARALSAQDTPYLLRTQAWLARAEGRTADAQALFARALAEARVQAPEIQSELKAAGAR